MNPQEFPIAVDVDPPAAETAPATTADPKVPAKSYIMVEGNPMPAEAQPPESALQGAFRAGPKSTIVIDMVAALPIAQDMVRQARSERFAKNDADFMRAQQRGQETAEFVAYGDKLRAAPADPRLTDATTPGELLKAVDDIIAEF